MDIQIKETGNGGDIVLKTNDISVIHGFQNMIYLAMCGGNPGFQTPVSRLANEQAFDFWANSLLSPKDQGRQFNSLTEYTLTQVALNSAGRILIERAVIKDLEFMKSFAQVAVSVSIPTIDQVEISIKVKRLDNLSEKEFIYIWDSVTGELEDLAAKAVSLPYPNIFDQSFDFSFV